MKKIIIVIIAASLLSSCSLFHRQKYGCPTDGRNVGAEKLLTGDAKTIRKANRAKWRGG